MPYITSVGIIGVNKAIQQGERQCEVNVLVRLIAKRHGPQGDDIQNCLKTATLEEF